MKRIASKTTWGKPGNVALFGALSIGLVLGFAGLVIDMGLLYWAKGRSQNTAEAAALAAVRQLKGTMASLTAACNTARSIITANERTDSEFAFTADCNSPFSNGNEIIFGIWDESTQNIDTSMQDPNFIDAVKINISRDPDKNNGVTPLLMSVLQIFGSQIADSIAVSSSAIAIAQKDFPASEANLFPLAANSCGVLDDDGDVACGREVIIGDPPLGANAGANNCNINPSDCVIDSSGNHFNWTSGTTDNGNTSIYQTMANAAVTCLTTGVCAAGNHLKIGQVINIDGGNHAGTFNSNNSLAPNYIQANGDLEVQIAIFGGASSDCSTPGSSDGTEAIIGFATFRITQIASNGNNKFIRGEIICGTDTEQPGNESAGNFGTFGESNALLVK
jgi:hypothetical protein